MDHKSDRLLVIAYRELRLIELKVLKELHKLELASGQQVLEIRNELWVTVDQMHGIEILEWPARIAEVAMWLMDHQVNLEVSEAFGQYVARLPLEESPHIVCANALRTDWNEVLPAKECDFVLGNPPFVGGKYQTQEQRDDMENVWGELPSRGLLDYVTSWYAKTTGYLRGYDGHAALVSTNSITQGEQVGVLWPELFRRGIVIHFGHRTFSWVSDARGKAHVHVVIIGFGHGEPNKPKLIYDYDAKSEPLGSATVNNISPYLTDGSNRAVTNRSIPLCDVPQIGIGNKPIDCGNYLFEADEKDEFLALEPTAAPYIRRWYGAKEFLQGWERWCLWLGDVSPETLRKMPHALERVRNVKKYRQASKSRPTQNIADKPTRFHVENMPTSRYLLIPSVSSERRDYTPIGFMPAEDMPSNLVLVMQNATLYHFGILHSAMHMAWVRQVCGRLKSDYRYSARLVYNNYPWPDSPTDAQKQRVEDAAQGVLDARLQFPDATLADLYDPLSMPAVLRKAHNALDRAVDRSYRPQPFPDERRRFEFLFEQYERLTAPLTSPTTTKRRKRKK